MMDWRAEYQKKSMSLEQVVNMVSPGDHIVTGHATGEPHQLIIELIRQKDRFLGNKVELAHMVNMYPCEYCNPEYADYFHHNSLFVGAGSRKAVNNGQSDYTPMFFHHIPHAIRDGLLPVDVAMIQVSQPDENGNMSFGVSVDYTLQATKSARIVLAEVNKQMPRTSGSQINISEIDALVEVDVPLPELAMLKIGPVEEKIGGYVASLIPDGSNLHLGIGGIPEATLKFLTDKKNLGIHTEMFSDGVVDLVEKGVVNNKCNNLNPGKLVATFLIGSRRLYDFVDNNPDVLMLPVDTTNNPAYAGRVDKLISINSALQVDLNGQVCADTIGEMQYSSVGGQVDFVRAAAISKDGKSIIAFPSTGKGGTISRIVANLSKGACVTTSRFDVQYIVTEYGIADLRGKSVRARKEVLINIAHPDFREQLRAES